MSLHVYRSPGQSLIKEQRCPWIVRGFKLPAWPANRLLWARCCDKQRPAKNLYVQHYYDGSYIWCLPGKGCKSEAEAKRVAKRKTIAAKAGWKTRRKAAALTTERWPNGCHDPDSCARHLACMYIQCKRHSKDGNEVAEEISAAIPTERSPAEKTGEGQPAGNIEDGA